MRTDAETALPKRTWRSVAASPFVHRALIVLAGAAVYAGSLHAPFFLDDVSTVNGRLADLGAFLRGPFWTGSRSIADLTFALNYAVHGLDVTGYHLVNVLIHLVNGLLVHRVVAVSFETPFLALDGMRQTRRCAAVAAGMLFVVHPLQTGAVTYVAQRYASLATLFVLLALVLYVEWRRRQSEHARGARWWWIAALVASVLAMRTKEIAFTLPVLLALFELLFLTGAPKRRILALAPFFLAMTIIPVTIVLSGISIGDLRTVDPFASRLGMWTTSRSDYLLTQPRVVLSYLRLLLVPIGQSVDHDVRLEHELFAPAVLASLLALLALAAGAVVLVLRSARGERALRLVGFGVLWFLVTLAVESSVIPLDDLMFEHRAYLPSVGFVIGVAAMLVLLRDRLAGRPTWMQRTLSVSLVGWIAVLAAATVARNELWADPIALWSDAVEKGPAKARPHLNLGVALAERGLPIPALREFQTVVRLEPDGVLGHYNLAESYLRLGLVDPAIHELEELLRLAPDSPATRTRLAGLYRQKGLLQEAMEELHAALRSNPGHAPARRELELLGREMAARPPR
ncbi:MAG TPA: tetratricopeptide repeat protein [Anaeromyxobacter sp.]